MAQTAELAATYGELAAAYAAVRFELGDPAATPAFGGIRLRTARSPRLRLVTAFLPTAKIELGPYQPKGAAT
jgi:hypothetical protein